MKLAETLEENRSRTIESLDRFIAYFFKAEGR